MKRIVLLLTVILASALAMSAQSNLDLSEKQEKKIERLNKRYSDVVGQEIEVKFGKPIYGDHNGPFYDTPGRPHPSGRNGVPGSWSHNQGGQAAQPMAASQSVEPIKVSKKLLKRRAKYEKKMSKILTPDQFETWKSRQVPFVEE